MNQALQIGPLSLPYSVLLTLVGIALGGFVAHRLARASGTEVEPTLTYMLFVGLVAARLAYVLRWHDPYFDLPLSILNIRDGGWEPAAGVVAAMLFGLQRARRQAGLRKPVLAAAFTTGAVLLLGVRSVVKIRGLVLCHGYPGRMVAFPGTSRPLRFQGNRPKSYSGNR